MHIHNIHLKLGMTHGSEFVCEELTCLSMQFGVTSLFDPKKDSKELPKAARNQGLLSFLIFFPWESFMKLTAGQVRIQYSNHYLF